MDPNKNETRATIRKDYFSLPEEATAEEKSSLQSYLSRNFYTLGEQVKEELMKHNSNVALYFPCANNFLTVMDGFTRFIHNLDLICNSNEYDVLSKLIPECRNTLITNTVNGKSFLKSF